MTQATRPESAVDLARWPIDDLGGGRRRRLLEDVRAEVVRLGACTLEGFLRPAATRRLAQKAAKVADRAHHHEGRSTPYLELPGDLDGLEPNPHAEALATGEGDQVLQPREGPLVLAVVDHDPILHPLGNV